MKTSNYNTSRGKGVGGVGGGEVHVQTLRQTISTLHSLVQDIHPRQQALEISSTAAPPRGPRTFPRRESAIFIHLYPYVRHICASKKPTQLAPWRMCWLGSPTTDCSAGRSSSWPGPTVAVGSSIGGRKRRHVRGGTQSWGSVSLPLGLAWLAMAGQGGFATMRIAAIASKSFAS